MEIISIEAGVFEEMNSRLNELICKSRKESQENRQNLTGWLDNQDVCIMLDISPRKLLTLRRMGTIPYSKIDRKIYYRKEDIVQFMSQELEKGNI